MKQFTDGESRPDEWLPAFAASVDAKPAPLQAVLQLHLAHTYQENSRRWRWGGAAPTKLDDDAAKDFQKVIDEGYYIPESYRGLGLAQMCEQDYPDASISFEKSLLNVEGQSRSFQRDLASCWPLQGKVPTAAATRRST